MGGCYCPGCKGGYGEGERSVSLFKAPSEKKLLEVWQNKIPRLDRTLSSKDHVCEIHFLEEDIVRHDEFIIQGRKVLLPRWRPALKKDAVPKIFPNMPPYLSTGSKKRKPPAERFQHCQTSRMKARKNQDYMIERDFVHVVEGKEVRIPREKAKLKENAVPVIFPNQPSYRPMMEGAHHRKSSRKRNLSQNVKAESVDEDVSVCCVVSCRNQQKSGCGKTFHKFPSRSPGTLKKWISCVGRENWTPTNKSVICSDHFEEAAFDRTRKTVRIRNGALPTIFPASQKGRPSRKTWKIIKDEEPTEASLPKKQVLKSAPPEQISSSTSFETSASGTDPVSSTELSLPVSTTKNKVVTSPGSNTESGPMYLLVSPTERIPLVPFTSPTLSGPFRPTFSTGTDLTIIPTNVPSDYCINCQTKNEQLKKLKVEHGDTLHSLYQLKIKYHKKCTETETLRKQLKASNQRARHALGRFSGLAKIIESLEAKGK